MIRIKEELKNSEKRGVLIKMVWFDDSGRMQLCEDGFCGYSIERTRPCHAGFNGFLDDPIQVCFSGMCGYVVKQR